LASVVASSLISAIKKEDGTKAKYSKKLH